MQKLNCSSNEDYLLSTLNLISVNQIILFGTLIFIFNIINEQTPQYLIDKIKFNIRKIQLLRHSNNIKLTNAIQSGSQNAIFYRKIQFNNFLPNNIKNIESFEKKIEDKFS